MKRTLSILAAIFVVSVALAANVENAAGPSADQDQSYLQVPLAFSGDPIALQATQGEAQSALDAAALASYCSDGNYESHYYNNYYGNQDGREFYYFERSRLALCSSY